VLLSRLDQQDRQNREIMARLLQRPPTRRVHSMDEEEQALEDCISLAPAEEEVDSFLSASGSFISGEDAGDHITPDKSLSEMKRLRLFMYEALPAHCQKPS
jgi:hypothetical protein